MTDFAGEISLANIEFAFPGRKAIYDRVAVDPRETINDPASCDPGAYLAAAGIVFGDPFVQPPAQDFVGVADSRGNAGAEFFEKVHVIPRSFILGNVLATTTIPVEVMNAFRREPKDWTTFVNNAGTGVTLLGQPALPFTLANLASIASLNLEVSTTGPPAVDSTLDFGFDVPITLLIPITLRRVVLFGVVPPELPYREVLSFLTEIHRSKDQTEKRQSLRQDPRDILRFEFGVEEGRERTIIENLVFGRLGTTFGIPIYHEAALTTAALTAGATTLPVDSTAFADFRTDGFVVIYQDGDTFDVAQTTTIDPTSFEITPPLTNSYAAGVRVAPLRLADTPARVPARRFRKGLSFLTIEFRVLDNRIDIASAAAFSTYNSKPLLDDPNFVSGTNAEQWTRALIVLDNETGQVFQSTLGTSSRHVSPKTFWAAGKQAIWELRQLMHFLRGRQISFYLPTFSDDFEVLNDLVGASNQIDVRNTGYGQTVGSFSPRNVIRVTFNNGDPPLLREIIGAIEISATQETLTLDDTWPSGVPVAEVERVELVEKVRLDRDEIEIEYQVGAARAARVQVPVISVLGE